MSLKGILQRILHSFLEKVYKNSTDMKISFPLIRCNFSGNYFEECSRSRVSTES